METVSPVDELGIAERIRRGKGRAIRSQIAALRLTPEEETELRAAASRDGKFLGEWTREVLLQKARTGSTDLAVITELTALRMLLSTVLRSIALKETVTPDAYAQILAQVREGKHDAAQGVLDQYRNTVKEQ
jgi:hypothetical protein